MSASCRTKRDHQLVTKRRKYDCLEALQYQLCDTDTDVK